MLPTFTLPVDLAVDATANTTASTDVPKQHNDPVADIDWMAFATTHPNSLESFLPFQNALTDEFPLFGFAGQTILSDGTGIDTSLSDAPHSNAGQSITTPEFHLLDQQDFGLDLESLLPPALLHAQVPESLADDQQDFWSHVAVGAFSTPPLVWPEATADYMDDGYFSANSSSCGIGCTESVPEQSTTYGSFAPLHTLASNLAAPQDVDGPGFAFDNVSSEFPDPNITSYSQSVFMLPPANMMSSGDGFYATLDWNSMRLPQFTPSGSSTASSPASYYTLPQSGWAPDSSAPVAGPSSAPATARQGQATKARDAGRDTIRRVSKPHSGCAADADAGEIRKILEEARKVFENENPNVVCKWDTCTETVAMKGYREHLRKAHGVDHARVSCGKDEQMSNSELVTRDNPRKAQLLSGLNCRSLKSKPSDVGNDVGLSKRVVKRAQIPRIGNSVREEAPVTRSTGALHRA
ncbi:hypothetical protein B0H11DRAFT_2307341 [Mycena galericulata]|nr:hypothetical protein B0H11DRAFT_2307341 [Mycena galericulata]